MPWVIYGFLGSSSSLDLSEVPFCSVNTLENRKLFVSICDLFLLFILTIISYLQFKNVSLMENIHKELKFNYMIQQNVFTFISLRKNFIRQFFFYTQIGGILWSDIVENITGKIDKFIQISLYPSTHPLPSFIHSFFTSIHLAYCVLRTWYKKVKIFSH